MAETTVYVVSLYPQSNFKAFINLIQGHSISKFQINFVMSELGK